MPTTRQSTLSFGGKELAPPPAPPLETPSTSIALSELNSSMFDDIDSPIPTSESSAPPTAPPSTAPSETSRPKKRRPRTSYVYKYMRDIDFHGNITDSEGREIWKCRFCSQTFDITNSTTNPGLHLASVHGLKSANTIIKNVQLNIQQATDTRHTNKSAGHSSLAYQPALNQIFCKAISYR